MRITVVTVCFNSAEFIADALCSVDAQVANDYELEHLIIDGGSTDATMAIVGKYPRKWRHARSEPDGGIYDAMNKGLQAATGDFVGFLNADDVFDNPRVMGEIARAASRSSCDAIYGDLVYVAKSGLEKRVRYWRSGKFDPRRLRFGWMPPHPTLYVRRSRVAALGLFNADLRISADYDFILRYFSQPAFEATYLPQVLVRMRMGGASNRSIGALFNKSREDLLALRHNGVGGLLAVGLKNARKLPQFFLRPKPTTSD